MIQSVVTKDPYFRKLSGKRIGVLMGGRSTEREISLMSGRGAMAALKRLGLDAVAVDAAGPLARTLTREKVDIAFLAVHGRFGEDGTLQGFLEYLGIPYTGSGVHASALAMNKVTAKEVFRCRNIPTPPYFTLDLTRKDWESAIPESPRPGFPLFIKPFNDGSSMGCHRVCNCRELLKAVRAEKKRYPRLLCEKAVVGRELTVGVLDRGNGPEALPVLEVAPRHEFYDYKAKYTEGLTDFIVPAKLTSAQTRRVKALAVKAHEVLNCHGYSRTDFMLDAVSGIPYVLELNTLPGLTALSDIPAEARAAGITYDELIYHILRSALTIHRSVRRKDAYAG